MSFVIFRNKGVIDPRSITTFGVSSKENPGAIGFFGTGLKYAIAILLREGCDITIYAGTRQLDFGVKRDKVRVDEFNVVTMNKRRLGFTTEVGKTWEVWQAFRELYCNCVDERGEVFEANEVPEPKDGETLVAVRGEKFLDVWASRSDIILSSEPIERNEAVHIHPGPSQFVFYRGVRAYRLDNPSQFTYNIQRKVDLTEDRTIKYSWDISACARRGLCESTNEQLVKKSVTAPKGNFENNLDFEGVEPSKVFLSTVSELARGFDSNLNRSALKAAQVWIMDQLHENATPMRLSDLERNRLDKAATFCESIGFAVREYPIIVSEFLGDEVLGRAHEGKIYISKRTLMMGTKMLAGTLIEEFIHLRHHLYDESRTMQNFLMDTIVSLGEQITGEAL
ncbi:MAG: hypothetical protein RBT55_03435 [Rhodocyclaceae bacterium]|nr:hypothetical protein [Rhodocyclaceae bacterium]